MAKRYQVIIVGGGPTGLGLAVQLGLRGVSCVLVETRTAPHRIPKGQYLTHRSVEHFYFWGIVGELRAARILPRDVPVNEITADDNMMSGYWYAQAGREQIRGYYFQFNERMPQYLTEGVLKARMESLDNVESRLGWTARDVRQDDRGVRVAIAREGGAEQEVLEADYVVGCDGGRSMVREQVGIARSGHDFDQLMVLAVFRSRELHERFQRFPVAATFRAMHPVAKGYW